MHLCTSRTDRFDRTAQNTTHNIKPKCTFPIPTTLPNRKHTHETSHNHHTHIFTPHCQWPSSRKRPCEPLMATVPQLLRRISNDYSAFVNNIMADRMQIEKPIFSIMDVPKDRIDQIRGAKKLFSSRNFTGVITMLAIGAFVVVWVCGG